MKKEEMDPDLTDTEAEFSLKVGNALRLVVLGAFAILRDQLKNGHMRPEVGQVIMAMQLATASASVARQMRISPDLMKQFFDQACQEIIQDENKTHHEPGNA